MEEDNDEDANIYFKNVDYEITDHALFDIFAYIGEIKSLHIVRDAKGRSRGFGFMSYHTSAEAQRAILELNGKFLGRKPILVMLHIRKEDRRTMKRMFQEHAEKKQKETAAMLNMRTPAMVQRKIDEELSNRQEPYRGLPMHNQSQDDFSYGGRSEGSFSQAHFQLEGRGISSIHSGMGFQNGRDQRDPRFGDHSVANSSRNYQSDVSDYAERYVTHHSDQRKLNHSGDSRDQLSRFPDEATFRARSQAQEFFLHQLHDQRDVRNFDSIQMPPTSHLGAGATDHRQTEQEGWGPQFQNTRSHLVGSEKSHQPLHLQMSQFGTANPSTVPPGAGHYGRDMDLKKQQQPPQIRPQPFSGLGPHIPAFVGGVISAPSLPGRTTASAESSLSMSMQREYRQLPVAEYAKRDDVHTVYGNIVSSSSSSDSYGGTAGNPHAYSRSPMSTSEPLSDSISVESLKMLLKEMVVHHCDDLVEKMAERLLQDEKFARKVISSHDVTELTSITVDVAIQALRDLSIN